MKSASRNKLLHCFRPMVDMDEPEIETDPGFNYLVFEKSHSDGDENSRTVSGKKRSLSRVVKAVFFETLLAKRARGFSKSKELRSSIKKSASCSFLSDSGSESAKQKNRKMIKDHYQDHSIAKKIKYEKVERSNMGLYMFMISLAVTVLFGKLLAIVFTSIWLYVVFAGERARKSRRRGKTKVIMESLGSIKF